MSREWEFGFDASWLDDRLTATFTYFDQQTTDALMFVSAIPSQGFTRSQLQNVGTVGANGIELQLDARLFQSTSFQRRRGAGGQHLQFGGQELVQGRNRAERSRARARSRCAVHRSVLGPQRTDHRGTGAARGGGDAGSSIGTRSPTRSLPTIRTLRRRPAGPGRT